MQAAENQPNAEKPRAKLGRPFTKSDSVIKAILDAVESGLMLSDACRANGINPHTWWKWVGEDEELNARFSRARELQTHALADQTIRIADTEDDPRRAQVRIQARQWLAAKRNAQAYGDKTQVAVTHTLDLSTALLEARARLSQIGGPVIDNDPEPQPSGCSDEG